MINRLTHWQRWARLLSAWTLAAMIGCTPVGTRSPAISGSGLVQQERQNWCFQSDGVCFDNQLASARLNAVERLGPGRYRAVIVPEVQPINPSPWYGFRIRAQTPQPIDIEMDYAGYEHRYRPKLSVDGSNWRELAAEEFRLDARGRAHLMLDSLAAESLIFAQPPLGPAQLEALQAEVSARVQTDITQIGVSVQGRPLTLFEFGGDAHSPLVIVLGRQHPPENTGSAALIRFVQTLAGDSAAAREYRQRVRTLVMPMLNPDGVANGHWRGNAHGQDLNRDWGPFAQPETRALRDALLAHTETAGRPVLFAIDFHSTYHDVLYSVAEDPSRQPGGLLRGWIDAMNARFPGRIEEQAYAAASSVFKNWVYCRFGAPAVTYEVGDDTTAEVLAEVADAAAMALIEQSRRPLPARAPACVASAAGG